MVYPNPQIYPHLKAIFVHVPKTGGTSIEQSLKESPARVVGGHTTALGYQWKFPAEFAEYFTFAVMRHPAARFLSAWRYLRAMPVLPALNNAGIHECSTFANWMEKLRGEAGLVEDIVHLHPQHRFVCDGHGGVLVDRLYRYEEIDTAWAEICVRLGLELQPLVRLNVSKALEPTEGRITERQGEWIAEFYAEDFRLGGYDLHGFEHSWRSSQTT